MEQCPMELPFCPEDKADRAFVALETAHDVDTFVVNGSTYALVHLLPGGGDAGELRVGVGELDALWSWALGVVVVIEGPLPEAEEVP